MTGLLAPSRTSTNRTWLGLASPSFRTRSTARIDDRTKCNDHNYRGVRKKARSVGPAERPSTGHALRGRWQALFGRVPHGGPGGRRRTGGAPATTFSGCRVGQFSRPLVARRSRQGRPPVGGVSFHRGLVRERRPATLNGESTYLPLGRRLPFAASPPPPTRNFQGPPIRARESLMTQYLPTPSR